MNTRVHTCVAIGLAAAVVANTIAIARADIRITNDMGGNVQSYWDKVDQVRASGERVIIDGRCYSACTLWLRLVRYGRLCVTPRAEFGFHSAMTSLGFPDPVWNERLTDAYPDNVKVEIGKRGGLWLNVITIKGVSIAPRCK